MERLKTAGKIRVLSRFFIAFEQLYHFAIKCRQRAKYGRVERLRNMNHNRPFNSIKKILILCCLGLAIWFYLFIIIIKESYNQFGNTEIVVLFKTSELILMKGETMKQYLTAIIDAIKATHKANQAPAHVEPLPLMPNYSNRFKPATR